MSPLAGLVDQADVFLQICRADGARENVPPKSPQPLPGRARHSVRAGLGKSERARSSQRRARCLRTATFALPTFPAFVYLA